jgi:hypothetical protein
MCSDPYDIDSDDAMSDRTDNSDSEVSHGYSVGYLNSLYKSCLILCGQDDDRHQGVKQPQKSVKGKNKQHQRKDTAQGKPRQHLVDIDLSLSAFANSRKVLKHDVDF